jgi:hypothetical protein
MLEQSLFTGSFCPLVDSSLSIGRGYCFFSGCAGPFHIFSFGFPQQHANLHFVRRSAEREAKSGQEASFCQTPYFDNV